MTTTKTALVTGSNRGLGKGFVEELEAKGYVVFAGMRNLDKNPFDSKNIIPVQLDVLDDASIKKAVKVVAQKGPLEILVNNVGTNEDTTPGGKKND